MTDGIVSTTMVTTVHGMRVKSLKWPSHSLELCTLGLEHGMTRSSTLVGAIGLFETIGHIREFHFQLNINFHGEYASISSLAITFSQSSQYSLTHWNSHSR